MESVIYEGDVGQVSWRGNQLTDGSDFESFMSGEVAKRLNDSEANTEFETLLRGLTTTGFGADSLNAVLSTDTDEERDWAVGEAMAEALLTRTYGVVWPWNMERDKRTPLASLPGADLIGFVTVDGTTQLVIGEVKTSSDTNTPPNVLYGRSGMIHQLDNNLVNNLAVLKQILKWLHPRCKGTEHMDLFMGSARLFFESGNKALCLFGILIRDTSPAERDLSGRARVLSANVEEPTVCRLLAYYLPCTIADLPEKTVGGLSE